MAGFSPAALALARPRGGSPQAFFGASRKAPVAIEEARGAGADQGRDDEQPELGDRAGVRRDADQRRADRAGRIDRGAGDVDADQMNGDQGQANREAGEAGRRERVGDAENADQEQERRDHFVDEGRNDIVFADDSPRPSRSGRATPVHP